MHFNELTVQPYHYHDELNPLLWENNKLKPDIRYKLMLIAKHFAGYLNVPELNLRDVTISGSNAAYGYSDKSDVDLHLVVDMPRDRPELEELYAAKKNLYNFTYNIKVKGIDVELYVQDVQQVHHSAGIYSILRDKWLSKPKHRVPSINDKEVRSKARNYASRINLALRSDDLNTAKEQMAEIRRLRQAGLEAGGEYSVENLAFKMLRDRGRIDKLRKHIDQLQSAELSLKEKQ